MKTNRLIEDIRLFVTRYLPSERGLSENTIRSYKDAFRLLLKFLSERLGKPQAAIAYSDISETNISAFLNHLEEGLKLSASTRNQRLAAVSSFAKYAAPRSVDGLALYSEVSKIPQKKTPTRKISFFSGEEVSTLLSTFDKKSPLGLRNYVMLSFMYVTGARAQETCDLRERDIAFRKDGKATAEIVGKGRKRRKVSIPAETAKLLRRYIDFKKGPGDPGRHVFESQGGRQMKISCIEEVFAKAISQAKGKRPELFPGHYTPHSMRHTTATHMLQANVPLIVIKNVLGHASLDTTQIYAEVTTEVAEKYLKEFRSANGGERIGKQGDRGLDFLK